MIASLAAFLNKGETFANLNSDGNCCSFMIVCWKELIGSNKHKAASFSAQAGIDEETKGFIGITQRRAF